MELLERVIKLETKLDSVLPILATKEDLAREAGGLRSEFHKEMGGLRAEFHKEVSAQTLRFVTWVTGLFVTIGGALVAATYFIAKHV